MDKKKVLIIEDDQRIAENISKGLEEKGFVAHNSYGNSHEYYPAISKEEYRKLSIKNVVSDYFGSSYKKMDPTFGRTFS